MRRIMQKLEAQQIAQLPKQIQVQMYVKKVQR